MIRKPDITDAILNLRPNSAFILENDDLFRLEWKDDKTSPPTREEIDIELDRLLEEYLKSEYQNFREKEYPSIKDQLDLLYHAGYEGWKNKIQEIKDKYPKGNI